MNIEGERLTGVKYEHQGRGCSNYRLRRCCLTLLLGMMWAPSVSINAFKAPEARRIFYWHVPSAWAAMIAFGMLFVGSIYWFFKRSDWAWRLHVASSEAGLATGLSMHHFRMYLGCCRMGGSMGLDRCPPQHICSANLAFTVLGFSPTLAT